MIEQKYRKEGSHLFKISEDGKSYIKVYTDIYAKSLKQLVKSYEDFLMRD